MNYAEYISAKPWRSRIYYCEALTKQSSFRACSEKGKVNFAATNFPLYSLFASQLANKVAVNCEL